VVLAWLGLPLQKNFAGEKSASTPTYDTYSIYTLLQVHILGTLLSLWKSWFDQTKGQLPVDGTLL